MELVTMQDMDTDLLNFDAFFSTNNDDEVQELWALTTSPTMAQDDEDHELLDSDDIEPLSPQLKHGQGQNEEHDSTRHCQQQQELEPHDGQQDAKQRREELKGEASGKRALQLDTVMANDDHEELVCSSENGWMTQLDDKAVVTPTTMLPARFQLLSTTCVYEPGFTSSPRGKRRISETAIDYDEDDDEEEESDCDCGHDEAEQVADHEEAERPGSDAGPTLGDSGFFLSPDDDDYNLPVFTDAELSAMVDSPSKVSTTSTTSACSVTSPSLDDAMPQAPSSLAMSMAPPLASLQTLCFSSGPGKVAQSTRSHTHDHHDVGGMLDTIYGESSSFAGSTQQHGSFQDAGSSSGSPALSILATNSQQLFSSAPLFPFSAASTASVASSGAMATTATSSSSYFSPSSYAEAANQFIGSQQHPVQPFFLNPDALSPVTKAAFFPDQREQMQTQVPTQPHTSTQLAAAVAMANSAAAMNTIRKLNATYGVPIAPLQRRAGSLPPNLMLKGTPALKPRLAVARAASMTSVMPLQARVAPASGGKGTRLAITPDIADFKLVQIFHQFCDPSTKLLTLPRFQQLVLHHQVKEDAPSGSSSGSGSSTTTSTFNSSSSASAANANVVAAPDAPTLFKLLDVEESGVLDLERFMQSFQICNRCTEAKRRAHQALCASQGQAFSPSALERQLMEDVAPVLVRVVPTRFEGCKVKSCEHYQWTWCEGFDKTGNEKCRGTNRHDKCPKYLANCTLWKHKLPPKSRKPKPLPENLDSPSKKLKHFS